MLNVTFLMIVKKNRFGVLDFDCEITSFDLGEKLSINATKTLID